MSLFLSLPTEKKDMVKLISIGSNYISLIEEKDNKTELKSKTELTDIEGYILTLLATSTSATSPVNLEKIITSYNQQTNTVLSLDTLKSNLSSIQHKIKQLHLSSSNTEPEVELIKTENGKDYFITLPIYNNDNSVNITNQRKAVISTFYKLIVENYKIAFLKRSLQLLCATCLALLALYFAHITILSSMVKEYGQHSRLIAHQASAVGCSYNNLTQLRRIFSGSRNAHSMLLNETCLISHDGSEIASLERVLTWKNNDAFVYPSFIIDGNELIFRINKEAIQSRYYQLIQYLPIDAIRLVRNNNDVVSVGENPGIAIFTHQVNDKGQLTYYSANPIKDFLLIFAAFAIITYSRFLYCFGHYLMTAQRFKFKLEVVTNTKTRSPIFYEVLTNISGNKPALDLFFLQLRKSNLLMLHTLYLIETVKDHAAAYPSQQLSLNICPTLLAPRHLTTLLSALNKLNPGQFIIELTESSAIEYSKDIYTAIAKIQSMGFTIAVDDFGMGNNNIDLVRRVKPTYVKVDKSFVIGLHRSPESQSIVKNILALANETDTKVIFEGVECIKDQGALLSLNEVIHQGYLYQ
ncbi:EAL domain-containing protein [Photobacterium sanctipauli]|nr:EAL domain-containing protein [Photobacterium sanctipauli]